MLTKIKFILYFPWLLLEIWKSAFSVIKIIWQRKIEIEPVFEWTDAERLEEIGEVIYSNSITLTPGTVTLDINNNMLLVHALNKSSITDLQGGRMIKKIKSNLKWKVMSDINALKYKKVLLKVSGEALMGDKQFGHEYEVIKKIAGDIKEVIDLGVEVAIVVGGGNIYRGINAALVGMDRASADYIGMLATVINALTLQNVMESLGIYTRVLSAIPMMSVCEPYIRRKAKRHMEKKRVVIFAGGTGNPFCTTDSAAVLRAIEMNCDMLLKATQVDGVYDSDPKKNPDAKKYFTISYKDVITNNLQVMDTAAIAVARENKLPIRVFSIKEQGNFARVIQDKGEYTTIEE